MGFSIVAIPGENESSLDEVIGRKPAWNGFIKEWSRGIECSLVQTTISRHFT